MIQSISKREFQILEQISFAFTTQEIAKNLFISHHTVMSHRKNLLLKMDAKNTAGLVRRGFELGLLHVSTDQLMSN